MEFICSIACTLLLFGAVFVWALIDRRLERSFLRDFSEVHGLQLAYATEDPTEDVAARMSGDWRGRPVEFSWVRTSNGLERKSFTILRTTVRGDSLPKLRVLYRTHLPEADLGFTARLQKVTSGLAEVDDEFAFIGTPPDEVREALQDENTREPLLTLIREAWRVRDYSVEVRTDDDKVDVVLPQFCKDAAEVERLFDALIACADQIESW
ncbi:hypothetical protein FIV42_28075 [Persicimonas caeni]|uniref:Uncharacterized protein n=1 Tax=Persicimonas caeni TaxID=2292766 RepID=A0A4Y6Q1N3_PERCE|nr:hypothetical protein [Persicimonas caeni]QDG54463.1 hypothetical protein FIV42_28075 [Persicimonas caeni]QED35684.1 hypothetical protein FRD00_28070 [Persicimonas caeni]